MVGNLLTTTGRKWVVSFVVSRTHNSNRSTHNIHPYYYFSSGALAGRTTSQELLPGCKLPADRRLPTPDLRLVEDPRLSYIHRLKMHFNTKWKIIGSFKNRPHKLEKTSKLQESKPNPYKFHQNPLKSVNKNVKEFDLSMIHIITLTTAFSGQMKIPVGARSWQ